MIAYHSQLDDLYIELNRVDFHLQTLLKLNLQIYACEIYINFLNYTSHVSHQAYNNDKMRWKGKRLNTLVYF